MSSHSPLKRLRQRHSLEPLPEMIDVPPIGGRDARTVPVEQATLDDIEFALVALGEQQSALYSVSNALSTLSRMARRQGACGSDIGINVAARDLEAGQ